LPSSAIPAPMTALSIVTDQILRGLSLNNDKTLDSVSVPGSSINPAKNRLASKFNAMPVTLRWATSAGASAAPSIVQFNSPSEFSWYTFLVQVVTQISIPGQQVVEGISPIWAALNGDGH